MYWSGRIASLLLILVISIGVAAQAYAHCQVPCGIYDDGARVAQMLEDTETVGKAMKQMTELHGKDDLQSANQLTRWIMTKEVHASRIITTVSEYFLTQKVKPVEAGTPGYEDYLRKLADHHAVMRAAMKAKQSTDLAVVAKLQGTIETLASYYDSH
jgi:nickel superoxide dismutase